MQKPPSSRLPSLIRKSRSARLARDSGFGLIEVVVAMALIAGSYIAVVEAYQQMLLHYGQIQTQRNQLNRAQDKHERGSP